MVNRQQKTICATCIFYAGSFLLLTLFLLLQDWLNSFSEEEAQAYSLTGITTIVNCIAGRRHDKDN